MDYLPQLMLAWSIQWVGVLSPGPSVLLILSEATARGRKPAMMTALGVASGSIILASATVLGITAVMAAVTELIVVIRYLGACYLFWLAFQAFRKLGQKPDLKIRDVSSRHAWRSGFFLQMFNPKAIFFWLAVAAAGGVGEAPLWVVLLFVTGAFLNSLIGHGLYAFLLSSPPVRRAYQRFYHVVEGGIGLFFLSAGLKLLTLKTA